MERDAIYTQSGFIACSSSGWESTYETQSTDDGVDHPVFEAIADETPDDRLQPAEPAESDLQGNWLEFLFTEQHEITVSFLEEDLEHAPLAQLQETGIPVTQPDQGHFTDLDDDEITDYATSEDDQSMVSGWPSQTPSHDEDVDAHNEEIAADSDPISSSKVIKDPAIGQVYQCIWNDGDGLVEKRAWYFITRLPFGDFSEIGISGRLAASQLCDPDNFPSCCRRPTDDQGSVKWAPIFEDGGSAVKRRQVPCLFLQKGLQIPSPAEVFILPPDSPFTAWIDVRLLRREDHRHASGLDLSQLTGLAEGAAVVNAFKSRLAAIQASETADCRREDSSHLSSPTSASAFVDIGVEPAVSSYSQESLSPGSGSR